MAQLYERITSLEPKRTHFIEILCDEGLNGWL